MLSPASVNGKTPAHILMVIQCKGDNSTAQQSFLANFLSENHWFENREIKNVWYKVFQVEEESTNLTKMTNYIRDQIGENLIHYINDTIANTPDILHAHAVLHVANLGPSALDIRYAKGDQLRIIAKALSF